MRMLEKSITVGNVNLKNRLVMAPVALEKSDAGKVSEKLLSYYDERTQGGHIGLVVMEHSFVRTDGRASKNQLSVSSDTDIAGLSRLAKTIHKNGSLAIMQISHTGGAVKEGVTDEEAISPSEQANPLGALGQGTIQSSRAMSQQDIDSIIRSFTDAALRVKEAGFDGCELHSAHGYLLNQFYSPLTNKRTDAYCGNDLSGRIRLHLQIIQSVRDAVGKDFLLSMHFGGCDYTEGGSSIEDAVAAAVEFEKAGLHLLDMSGGMCFFLRPGHTENGYFSDLSKAVKQAVSIPVIVAGGVTSRDDAEDLLAKDCADLIGVGRPISQNADWAKTAMAGA
ncbi:MAG: NADH:flavin oxidoreductase [Clostridiales bacterium]|nr:NADH:flavin oxidoreductase [Clostridiales bacterium]